MRIQDQASAQINDPNAAMAAQIDWRLPPAPDDWMFGTGATRAERGLVWATTIPALGLLAWQLFWLTPPGWAWWHYLLSAVILLDVAGGAVANTLATAKRLYFGPLRQPPGTTARLLHSRLGFTVLHLHPLVIAALYPPGQLWWGLFWYPFTVLAVATVRQLPLYLARPGAMLIFTTAMLAQSIIAAPTGWGWFVPVFLAKLLLAHAVREEPYRPNQAQ